MAVEHAPGCDGHLKCPVTMKRECAMSVVWQSDGKTEIADTVMCFGCLKTHAVRGLPGKVRADARNT